MSAATESVRPGAPGPTVEDPTEPRPPRDRLVGTPTTRWDALAAAGVAAVVMVSAVVWRSPIVPTDPWHYVQRALTFPDSVWIPLGFTRYGIILANILPTRLFGNAEASYYFWTIVSAGVLAATVYLVGRRWWGPVAGLVAVTILFSNSVVFYNLTREYPDIMSMAVILAAVVCALEARQRGFLGRPAILWVLAAGFLLGWSFEIRETALFAWPLVVALLWKRGTVRRTMAIAVLPVLGWAALDVLISGVVYGDPLLKPKTLLGFGESASAVLNVTTRSRLDYLLAIPTYAIENRPDGIWMVVTGAVAILAVVVRDRPLRLVSLTFIVVLGLNLIAGGVLSPSFVVGDLYNTRYWIQYVPALALIIGGLTGLSVTALKGRLRTHSLLARTAVAAGVGLAVVAVPLVTAVRTVPSIEAFAANGGDALEELRTFADQQDLTGATVWTDVRTRRLLPIYQRDVFGGDKVWTGTVNKLPDDPATMASGDYVLIYSADDDTCFHCRIQVQPWLEKHPGVERSWDLVFRTESGNVEFYRVR